MNSIIIEGEGWKQAYSNPAGIDLPVKELIHLGGDRYQAKTGIRVQMPMSIFAVIKPRSSAFKRDIDVIEGTIDADYRGEILIQFKTQYPDNLTSFAQLVFFYKPSYPLIQGKVSNNTKRGNKGFGSSNGL